MNETCDRCGPAVRAAYRVAGDSGLYLCVHCTRQLSSALSAQGWTILLTSQDSLASQAR